ncbi:MAG: hypothetical protein ABI634_01305 [Acidobacteriota bacterium]
MRTVLRIFGILACLIGLIWLGQGTGYFPYPATSFMISQTPWAYRGGALICAGLLMIRIARRR